MSRRLIALAALISSGVTIALGMTAAFRHPLAIGASLLGVVTVLEGVIIAVTTTSAKRLFGAALILTGVALSVGSLFGGAAIASVLGVIGAGLVTTILALWAFRPRPYRPPVERTPPPRRPFILMNARSGDGKVKRFGLDDKARRLGADVAYIEHGVDVVETLHRAVLDGADLLGAAGGDGTQALVAQVATEHELPVLCIPAGTRNHFALDLGLDREDPVAALAALGEDGEQIRIDLGDVGGRPFVNNVSLGAYAEIVARPEYRDAKFNTVMSVLPEVADPHARSGLTVEADGQPRIDDPQLVQVANNPYARANEPFAAGTRPRLDTGILEVDVVAYKTAAELRDLVNAARRQTLDRARAYRGWMGERIRVHSREGTIRAGVDGEAVEFASPLEIRTRPGVLRVRVPKVRPGPKMGWPRVDLTVVRQLWSIASGSSRRGA